MTTNTRSPDRLRSAQKRGRTRLPSLPTSEAYVDALTIRWQFYDNVPSKALEDQWAECLRTYNTASTTDDNKIRVLPCVTGSAKTLGAAVYAAMFIRQEVPGGILVVTRTIEQANSFVKEVRKQLVRDHHLVEADHSRGRAPTEPRKPLNDERLDQDEIDATQILVITHGAYFERILKGTQELPYMGQTRRLTIIDEALNGMVSEYRVRLKPLERVLSYIDDDLAKQYGEQYSALLRLQNLLRLRAEMEKEMRELVDLGFADDELKAKIKDLRKTRLLCREDGEGLVPFREYVDMQPLLNAMRRLPFDKYTTGEEHDDTRKRVWSEVRRVLNSCEGAIRLWVYVLTSGNEHSLNTAQLILNQNLKGVVCLDATARLNPQWKLLGDRVEINTRISRDVRNYSNVRHLYVETYGTGKEKMEESVKVRGPRFFKLLDQLGLKPEDTVFISHKGTNADLQKLNPHFKFTWWGALDGKNDWSQCTGGVYLGLNYLSDIHIYNSMLAVLGLPVGEWFDEEDPEFREARNTYQIGHLAATVVQGINRPHCRKTIDEKGNCAETLIVGSHPRGAQGELLREMILEEMPGIRIEKVSYWLDHPADELQEGSAQKRFFELVMTLPGGSTFSETFRTASQIGRWNGLREI